jgi:amino acid adenylation domain-containing protein
MIEQESSGAPAREVDPDNLAYVIYTSGSTGKPKGIMIDHKNLADYLGWVNEFIFDGTVGTLPAVQNLGFDGSLKQIFAPLLGGREVWLFSKEVVSEPARLIEALGARRSLRFSCVPSLWKAMLDTIESGQAALAGDSITHLFVGGEPLGKGVVDRSFALLPRLQLWNLYGPSETTATATAARIDSEDKITIGRPIAGKRAYILGSRLQPVPIGVPGELYLGGSGPARGYVGRPELTAESFIPDPFSGEPGARMYKSGDLARYLPDGRIEFLGRIDHQVKVRGFRIELGEIEAALRQHPKLRDAVAAARVDARGDDYLVAYVVADGRQAPAAGELRTFLREKLPDYMIPSVYVAVERLPLMPNGKIDRSALPEPDRATREQGPTFVAPRNTVEEAVASIFSEVLGVASIGADDNFFDLGGHSLLATQVVSRARKMFKVNLPLRQFFESPTVAALAESVIAGEAERGRAERIATLMKKVESLSTDEVEELLSKKQKGVD